MARARRRFFDWNGKDVPESLRGLPAGHYALEPIAPGRKLTRAEEDGLRLALESVRENRTQPASAVHARLRAIVKKAAGRSPKRRAQSR
jgi:hypothetical protein